MKNFKKVLSCISCIAVMLGTIIALPSFAAELNAEPESYASMSGVYGETTWEYVAEGGVLTISPKDGQTGVSIPKSPTDVKRTREYFDAEGNSLGTLTKYMACPWGMYEWSADGLVSKADYSHVKKIVIEEGIKTIPEYGFHSNFYDNSNISDTFHTGLTELVLPAGLESIGADNFRNSKLTSVELPASLNTIGSRAFASDSASSATITSVKIIEPSQLQSIGSQAFDNQSKLETICLPESVNFIGNYAFRIPNLCIAFKGNKPEMNGNATFTATSKIYYPMGKTGWDIFVPSSVGAGSSTKIDSDSFTDFGRLGSDAVWFYDDTDGKNKLDIYGSGTVYVTWNARPWAREDVKEIAIHDGITGGNVSMFGGVYPHTALEKITIPSSMTALPDDFCSGCTKLKTVVFAENSQLTTIGSRAFQNTAIEVIGIPGSVTTLNDQCFVAKSLKAVRFDGNAPESKGNSPFNTVKCLVFKNSTASGFDTDKSWAVGTSGNAAQVAGVTVLDIPETGIYAVQSASADGTITANVYNLSNAEKSCTLIVAGYETEDRKRLVQARPVPITVAVGTNGINEGTTSGKLTTSASYWLKSYLWDINTLNPITDSIGPMEVNAN